MKKVLVAAAAGLGALVAYRKVTQDRSEQELWAEATDPVVRPTR